MSLAPLRTFGDILSGAPPESTALQVVDDGKIVASYSRVELTAMVHKMCSKLRMIGVRPGDVVSIAMGNTTEYISVFLAVTWIRAIAAPLNPNYMSSEFKYYLEDVNSKVLLLGVNGNKEAETAAKECNIPFFSMHNGDLTNLTDNGLLPVSSATFTIDNPMPTDVALYLHTSGTTSRPKLVPLTHHNLSTSMGNIRNTYELDAKDVCYLVMPLFHVHGLVGGLFSTLCSGGTVVIPDAGKFSASVFWNDVLNCKATWYTAVPTIHQILLQRAEHDKEKISQVRLRFIRSCSASLAPSIMAQLEKCFDAPVIEAYAMTEASHQMCSNPLPKNGPHKPGSVGRGTNVQIAILDNDNNLLTAHGTVGQVCIRGENVTTGYYNRPEANLEDFAGGWFHTGDQGFLDSDGYLTLTGRLKELINRGGEKISPIEIDSILLTHPEIAEAVVFGGPSEKYGEEVCAAVVLKTGSKLTEIQIQKFCATTLNKDKVPSKVFIAKSVPKTATGKIQRRFVAQAFLTTSKI